MAAHKNSSLTRRKNCSHEHQQEAALPLVLPSIIKSSSWTQTLEASSIHKIAAATEGELEALDNPARG